MNTINGRLSLCLALLACILVEVADIGIITEVILLIGATASLLNACIYLWKGRKEE